jgi:hypothetical protein
MFDCISTTYHREAAIILSNGIVSTCGTREMIPLLEFPSNSVPGSNDGADVVVNALVNKGCLLSMN